MSFILDLREAIKKNKPLPPLLDNCIRPPTQRQNPLITWTKALFGEQKLKFWVSEAIQDNLFNSIKENQEVLIILNSAGGRKYLHSQLDSILDYLTGTRFAVQYKCPKCSACFPGKRPNCPHCGISLSWKG